MTALHCLATGVLWKEPEQRVSKSTGNPFVTATLRCKDGDSAMWIRLLAFSETTQSELMRLGDGESVSVQDSLSAEIYQPPNRDVRINLTVFCDAVMPLRPAPKPRKPKPAKQAVDDRRESAPFDDGFPSNWGEAS